MREFYRAEIPTGNGYRGNAQGILRIKQHLDEQKSKFQVEVICKDGLPILAENGGFFLRSLDGNPFAPWGMVEGLLKLHYGISGIFECTAQESAGL